MAKVSLVSRFAHLMNMGGSPAAIVAAAPSAAAPSAADPKDDTDAEKPVKKDDESQEDFDKRLKEWEDAQEEPAAEGPKDVNDDEAKKAAAHAAGFKAGGQRWADVMASAEAGGRVALACSLLSDTDMPASAVINALAACPKENVRATVHDRRLAEAPVPVPAAGAAPAATGSDADWAAGVAATADKFRPKAAKTA